MTLKAQYVIFTTRGAHSLLTKAYFDNTVRMVFGCFNEKELHIVPFSCTVTKFMINNS